MSRDNAPWIRQKADLARKAARKDSYDRILIVTEGSRTEPLYFGEIRRHYRLNGMNVVVQPAASGTEPRQVVQYAKRLFENGEINRKINVRAFDQIYVVFDRDAHRTYFDALTLCEQLDRKLVNDEKQKIRFVAVPSIPCFEFWLLLHFEDVRHAIHRDAALQRLRGHLPAYDKGAVGSFEQTRVHLPQAIRRASSLGEQSNAFNDDLPHTAVGSLVSILTNLKTT